MTDLKDVIHLYIGCKVKTKMRAYKTDGSGSYYLEGTLKEVDLGMVNNQVGIHVDNESDECNYVYWKPEELKPILRPLPSITEDDVYQIAYIIGATPHLTSYIKEDIKYWCRDTERPIGEDYTINMEAFIQITTYLLSRHYDLHGLIESKQAIPKP